jgi:mRNA degradation ribonuclease J1/J2
MHGSVGKVMLIESGDILEIDELGARKAGRVNVGRVCIDSGSRTMWWKTSSFATAATSAKTAS